MQARHRRLGELGRIAVRSAQRGRGQEDVRHAADPGLGIVKQDGDAAPRPTVTSVSSLQAASEVRDLHD